MVTTSNGSRIKVKKKFKMKIKKKVATHNTKMTFVSTLLQMSTSAIQFLIKIIFNFFKIRSVSYNLK